MALQRTQLSTNGRVEEADSLVVPYGRMKSVRVWVVYVYRVCIGYVYTVW